MMNWFTLRMGFLSCVVNLFTIAYVIFNPSSNAGLMALLFQYSVQLDTDFQNMILNMIYFEAGFISYERCNHYTELLPEYGLSPPQV